MRKIKAVISDADGTLVNTLYLIRHGQYDAAVEYLVGQGIPRHHIPPYKEYESYINKSVGGPTRETFERTLRLLFNGERAKYLDGLDFNQLNAQLDPIQDHLAPLYVHPFYGLTELWEWLGRHQVAF